MLVIQELRTTWTKISRGGQGAAKRNSTPLEMPLPMPPSGAVFVHRVHFSEFDEFAPSPRSAHSQDTVPHDLSGFDGYFDGNDVLVRTHWTPHLGLPKRPNGRRIRLHLGEYCRLFHNGRLTDHDTGEWSYQSTVINIALVEEPTLELFMKAAWSETLDAREQLW